MVTLGQPPRLSGLPFVLRGLPQDKLLKPLELSTRKLMMTYPECPPFNLSLLEVVIPKLAGRLSNMQSIVVAVSLTEVAAVLSAVRLGHLRNSLPRLQFNLL
jgi:hypothetical protein